MKALPQLSQDKLERYLEMLIETNKVMNLTAIRTPEEIRLRHFEDSLRVLEAVDFTGAKVLDIGSGAGFPGLVLAVAREDIHVTLLDATGKKVEFMRSVCEALELTNVLCLHGRAEELAHDPNYRAQFDIAVSRGVTALPALCEISLPFLRQNGWMLAMKSDIEIYTGVSLFGGRTESPYVYNLTEELRHSVNRVRKKAPTPAVFPRSWAKIQKGPPEM